MARYIFNTQNYSFFIPKRSTYKLLENEIEITEEQYNNIMENIYTGKIPAYQVENNVLNVVFSENEYKPTEDELRSRRTELLKAFDIYKTNVVYGIVLETPEEKAEIYGWYLGLLGLDEESFNNIPQQIKYYL